MHDGIFGRTEAPDLAGRRKRSGLRARAGIVVALLVAGVALLPGAAKAASGRLTAATYSSPAGNLRYQLYVPPGYKAGMPMVVALHGCTQDAQVFRRLTRWDQLAAAKGFLVLFPEQDAGANRFKCWNFFQDGHMHRAAGEPMKIAGLTSAIARHYNVDPHRIYANGLSAGGAMSSVMAATYPDLFAAIGIGSGCEYASGAACAGYKSADPATAAAAAYREMGSRARPMPFIAFEGDADKTVPPVNADQLVQQWLVTNDMADDGAKNSSITTRASKTRYGQVSGGRSYTTRSYLDKARNELAQYWIVRGMNHAWSGGDASQQYSDPQGPDETAAMYAFFASHPRR